MQKLRGPCHGGTHCQGRLVKEKRNSFDRCQLVHSTGKLADEVNQKFTLVILLLMVNVFLSVPPEYVPPLYSPSRFVPELVPPV